MLEVTVLVATALAAAVMSVLARRAGGQCTGRSADRAADTAALRTAVSWDAAAVSVMVLGGIAATVLATA